MHVHVIKWGNSLGVRIPRVLAKKIGIHAGTPVDVSIQDHHLVISKGYSLQSMLDQIKAETIHEEIQAGPSCGDEAW